MHSTPDSFRARSPGEFRFSTTCKPATCEFRERWLRLAGLEQAIDEDDETQKGDGDSTHPAAVWGHAEHRRHPVAVYGRRVGSHERLRFRQDPAKVGDTRWVHRPKMKWEFLAELEQDGSIRKRIFTSLCRLIALRKSLPALAGLQMNLIDPTTGTCWATFGVDRKSIDGHREFLGVPAECQRQCASHRRPGPILQRLPVRTDHHNVGRDQVIAVSNCMAGTRIGAGRDWSPFRFG